MVMMVEGGGSGGGGTEQRIMTMMGTRQLCDADGGRAKKHK